MVRQSSGPVQSSVLRGIGIDTTNLVSLYIKLTVLTWQCCQMRWHILLLFYLIVYWWLVMINDNSGSCNLNVLQAVMMCLENTLAMLPARPLTLSLLLMLMSKGITRVVSSSIAKYFCPTCDKLRSTQLDQCGWGRHHCEVECSRSLGWSCSPSESGRSWSRPTSRWPCSAGPGPPAIMMWDDDDDVQLGLGLALKSYHHVLEQTGLSE